MPVFGILKSINVSSLVEKEEINLIYEGYSDKQLKKLSQVIENSQVLRKLNLGLNKITLRSTSFTNALSNNGTLKEINLEENRIGNEGAEMLANALKVNQTLQVIYLEANQINDGGARKLGDALRINQALRKISLRRNQISVGGAEMVADALKVNHTLQEIDLGENQIGNEGAGKLADALKVNQTLQEINLRGNQIGSEGAEKVADALKANLALRRIFLGGNSIGNEGAGKFADALKVNWTLQAIALWDNQIGVEGAKKLMKALANNSTLIEMNLDSNGLGEENEFGAIVVEIKKILNSAERMSNVPDPHLKFYSKLTSMAEMSHNIRKEFEELLSLITNIHMLKFYYTAASSFHRSGALSKKETSNHIREGLEKSTDLCLSEDEIADFKLILEKAESDGHIERRDLFRLDNRAEVKRMKSDPEILCLMEAVKSNTARIEGLEANVEAVNNSVNKIRHGLKHKLKVEAAVGFLSAAINAISFGVGGNVLDATAKALGSIVDFGDIVHIQTVAASRGAFCIQQVETGIVIAVDRYADRKLEDALKKGDILTVVAAAAVMMNSISNNPADKSEREVLTDIFHKSEASILKEGPTFESKLLPETRRKEPEGEHITDIVEDEKIASGYTVQYEEMAAPNKKEAKPPIMERGMTLPGSFEVSEVEEWILERLPQLKNDDLVQYMNCLVGDGFDSVSMLSLLKEEDLGFMKKAHKRALMERLKEGRHMM